MNDDFDNSYDDKTAREEFEFDLTKHLRDSRDSLQQMVYDLNFLYETCDDAVKDDVIEELNRIVEDIQADVQALRNVELSYQCGSLR